MNEYDKLCLGTVKLGMPDYGFSSGSALSKFDAVDFLNRVELMGIHRFDTSPRYGESERILGQYINQSTKKPIVSSKIDNLITNRTDTCKMMFASVEASLVKLNLEKLDICYLHQNEINIISDPYVHDGLRLLKDQGLVAKTGVSVYSFEECEYALESGLFDYIQVPVNVCDISFYDRFIKESSSTVHFVARSLLLQGILVNRDQIIDRISSGKEILSSLIKLDSIAYGNNISILQMALAFVFSLKNIDHYLIGTTSIENLKMNRQALKVKLPIDVFALIYELASQPKSWSNPRNWK